MRRTALKDFSQAGASAGALLWLTLVTSGVWANESPDEIAAILVEDHPHVAEILREYPEILAVWNEPWWADILLRSPMLPGSDWRSHDFRRPQPPVEHPAFRQCPSVPPPDGAEIVLSPGVEHGFAGDNLALWHLDAGTLTATGQQANRLFSRLAFGDVHLHLEFRTPTREPLGHWQYRGNSGVFLMGRYEVQILDSWNNPVYPDGMMGALYGQQPPLRNASLPPGKWQCLDIHFVAPRFLDAERVRPARATVILNGVVVQDDAEFLGPTSFGSWKPYTAHEARLPFALQDHGEPTSQVSFRKIWVVTSGTDDGGTNQQF